MALPSHFKYEQWESFCLEDIGMRPADVAVVETLDLKSAQSIASTAVMETMTQLFKLRMDGCEANLYNQHLALIGGLLNETFKNELYTLKRTYHSQRRSIDETARDIRLLAEENRLIRKELTELRKVRVRRNTFPFLLNYSFITGTGCKQHNWRHSFPSDSILFLVAGLHGFGHLPTAGPDRLPYSTNDSKQH